MTSIKNFEGFKKSLLNATNGTIEETLDESKQFDGQEYRSYRMYTDSVHYFNMFVIYNLSSNTYDVSLETSDCVVSTLSKVIKTQKAMVESVVRWRDYSYLNEKKISCDSEEYTDRCEKTSESENVERANGCEVFEGCKTVKSVRDVDKVCGDCSHFNACRQGNQTVAPACCMFDSLYKARKNLNWHHVSLNTLANIDHDMLDKKRRLYMKVYRMTANVINDIYKCNRCSTIDNLRKNLLKTVRKMAKNGAIEWALVDYVKAKLDNCFW